MLDGKPYRHIRQGNSGKDALGDSHGPGRVSEEGQPGCALVGHLKPCRGP